MGNPYTEVEVENYNLNAPPDDGSKTPSNEITWAKHKEKLGDPLKTAIEALNDAVAAAVEKLMGGVVSVSDDYTVLAANQGQMIVMTVASKTITTPNATTVGEPFGFFAVNGSNGVLTIDGSGSQTVDGASTITIPTGHGIWIETDGSNWFTAGKPLAINALSTLTAPDATADMLAIYDDSASAVLKITPANLFKIIAGLTEETSPDYANDVLPLYDNSATATDKVKLQSLALGVPHFILEDQKAQGTDGGTFTNGADRTRVLNTEVLDALGIVTLASNQFTIPAGTYYIEWSAPASNDADNNQSFLYNATDTAEVKRGTCERAPSGGSTRSEGHAVVTIAGSKAFEIRHRCADTALTTGLGGACNFGTEVYTWVKGWKLA